MFDDPIDFPKCDSESKLPFNPDDYFDDCPICLVQKRAIAEGRELTFDEFFIAKRETLKKLT